MADTSEAKVSQDHGSQKCPTLPSSLMNTSEPEPRSRVLVIHTGGTIGLKMNDSGGLPKKINNNCLLVLFNVKRSYGHRNLTIAILSFDFR